MHMNVNIRIRRLCTAVIIGMISTSILAGCASESGKTPQNAQQDAEKNTTQDQNDGDNGISPDTYRPSELAIKSQDTYEDPVMGLTFTLPKTLQEQMDSSQTAMLSEAEASEDASVLRYAFYSWNRMTKEQQEAEVPSKGDGYYEWADGLERIGTLGVYDADAGKDLDSLTKCTKHKELGKSEDGAYTYYLSVNPDAGQTEAVEQITAEITKMTPLEQLESETDFTGSLGEFSLQDITGKTYTQEMFQDVKLTMINVFTTWCTPCINEIPDLEKLHKEMADQGVNVVGIVLDAAGTEGSQKEEILEKAKLLAERTGVSYPFLIPEADTFNGRLSGITAVPETFFVDHNGNITGSTYSGSHSLEDWKSIVNEELDALTGGLS